MRAERTHHAAPVVPADLSGVDRYEFRIFRHDLGVAAAILAAVAASRRDQASVDRYLVLPHRLDVGVKLRDGRLEVKTLLGTSARLERWHPATGVPLPASGRELGPVLADLGLPQPAPGQRFPDADALAHWLAHGRGVRVVRLHKRRRRFLLPDALGEITAIRAGPTELRSLAVESVDPDAAAALVARLRLGGAENVSYPRFLAAHHPAARRLT
jgi:hypothetical protein